MQLHLVHFALRRQLSELYLNLSLRMLAMSLINIFVPVYLLTLGYSISGIIIFYLIYFTVWGCLTLPAAWLVSKIGMKHTIAASVPFLLAFYVSLELLAGNSGMFVLSAILIGAHEALYWLALHADFTQASDRRHRGAEVGFLFSLPFLFSIAGPFIGGVVIFGLGFFALFAFSAIALLVSVVPLLQTRDRKLRYRFSLRHIFRQDFRNHAGFFSFGARQMSTVVFWPIFVFSLLGTLSLGIIGSLEILFLALSLFIVGNMSDRIRPAKLLSAGSLLDFFAWLSRAASRTASQIASIAALGGIVDSVLNVPFHLLTYNRARAQKKPLEFLVFRELAITLGRLASLLIVLLVFSSSVQAGIVISAVAALGYLLFK